MRKGIVGDHTQAGLPDVLRLESEIEPMIVRVAIASAVVDAGILRVHASEECSVERLSKVRLSRAKRIDVLDVV